MTEKVTKLKGKKTPPEETGGNGKTSGMTEEEFKAAVGGDPDKPVEVVTNDQMKERLGALLSGQEEPSNEFVAYLVGQLRAGNAEYRQVQQATQELNQKLAQLQRRAIQLQGEQNKYAQDIMRWMDKDKPTGKQPGKESGDGK